MHVMIQGQMTALLLAAEKGDATIVQMLMDKGAKIEFLEPVSELLTYLVHTCLL
jgi:hypothetical protein